eukprot:1136338-Pelagomonas_calceolata.AAC.7
MVHLSHGSYGWPRCGWLMGLMGRMWGVWVAMWVVRKTMYVGRMGGQKMGGLRVLSYGCAAQTKQRTRLVLTPAHPSLPAVIL